MKQYQRHRALMAAASGSVVFLLTSTQAADNTFVINNLVSDQPNVAPHTDPNLVNPWGLASSGGSPLWVSDNGMQVSTLYNGAGVPAGGPPPLVVSIPDGAPTGVLFHSGSAFSGDRFIFATEGGTIAGWQGGTAATTRFSLTDAKYKGIGINNAGDTLFAANFHSGNVDVVNNSYGLDGSFTDPNIPAGFAPFSVQNLNGKLYVTFAKRDPITEDDVSGPGNGFVDVFDPTAHTFTRLISNGQLDSPWGLALAPQGFGTFTGDLLVGNFGDGLINAYDPNTGAFVDALRDTNGDPLDIEGLWALRVGNGGNGGNPNEIYFTAGPDDESHGLLGTIAHIPDSGASTGLLLGAGVIGVAVARRRKA